MSHGLRKAFLNHYDLAREEHRPTVGARVAVVRAGQARQAKYGVQLRALVIDLDTNVIREMDLVRVVNGKVAGTVHLYCLTSRPSPIAVTACLGISRRLRKSLLATVR